MTEFILVHGAWHGGWCWDAVVPILRRHGHGATAPTLSGLAERAGLLSRSIDLSCHVNDIVEHVRAIHEPHVTLVGHSYGGFPATLAAAAIADRVSHLVLLDAFLPADGEMLLDHAPTKIEPYRQAMEADEGWNIPPLPSAAFGVRESQQAWVDAQLTAHPVATYFEPARLPQPLGIERKTYIRCTQAPGDLLARSVARVTADPSWTYAEIDAPHDAMITHPEALASLLLRGAAITATTGGDKPSP